MHFFEVGFFATFGENFLVPSQEGAFDYLIWVILVLGENKKTPPMAFRVFFFWCWLLFFSFFSFFFCFGLGQKLLGSCQSSSTSFIIFLFYFGEKIKGKKKQNKPF